MEGEEEIIMENVVDKMKGLVGSSNMGPAHATAQPKFADIFPKG
jgi:hypothetical protein